MYIDIENKIIYGSDKKLTQKIHSEVKEFWMTPEFQKHLFPFSYRTESKIEEKNNCVNHIKTNIVELRDDWKYRQSKAYR